MYAAAQAGSLVLYPAVIVLHEAGCLRQVREASGQSLEHEQSYADQERQSTIEHLQDGIRRLRLMMAVVHVCAAALRHQNADSDKEVADVLQRHAGDRLSVEIELMEALTRRLSRVPRRGRPRTLTSNFKRPPNL